MQIERPKKRSAKVSAKKLHEKREYVKAGMVGSLAGLFFTGFFRFKGARMLHPYLGFALLGFSLWHHLISKPQTK